MVALARLMEERAWMALLKWPSWTAQKAGHPLLCLREFVERLILLCLWLSLDSSATTSAQRPVKSPSDQGFAQSLMILKVSCQDLCLPEGLSKMHLASIINLHQEFISEGEDKMEFNSVVTRPDLVSWTPLGTWWRVMTRAWEIKRRKGRLAEDSEWRPSPGYWFDKEETRSGFMWGHVSVRVMVGDGVWLEGMLVGTWQLYLVESKFTAHHLHSLTQKGVLFYSIIKVT